MPLYCVEVNRTLQKTERIFLNIWADNAEEASRYAWDNVEPLDFTWSTQEDLHLVDDGLSAHIDHHITDDPNAALHEYGVWNDSDVLAASLHDDYSSSCVPSSRIARYNMGEEIPT